MGEEGLLGVIRSHGGQVVGPPVGPAGGWIDACQGGIAGQNVKGQELDPMQEQRPEEQECHSEQEE
jgi:hypothetical protein